MDSKDRNILKAIQNDANLTVSELAKKVNLQHHRVGEEAIIRRKRSNKRKVTLLDQKNWDLI